MTEERAADRQCHDDDDDDVIHHAERSSAEILNRPREAVDALPLEGQPVAARHAPDRRRARGGSRARRTPDVGPVGDFRSDSNLLGAQCGVRRPSSSIFLE